MIERQVKVKGFEPLTSNNNGSHRIYTLNCIVFGQEGSGKSRFIATAPEPIGGLILDPKSLISIPRAAEESGKQIVLPSHEVTEEFLNDLPLPRLNAMDNDQFKDHYKRRTDKMIDLLMALYESTEIRTIFIDPFYQFIAELKQALQGKKQKMKKLDSGKVFQDNDELYQQIIKLLNRLNSKHTILTFKHKDEYINDNKSGRSTWDHGAFKHIGNHTNCAIELIRNPKGDKAGQSFKYALNFRNCLHNPTLEGPDGQYGETGLIDEAISFGMMARTIFPDLDDKQFAAVFGE